MRKLIFFFGLLVVSQTSAESIDDLKPYELPSQVQEAFGRIARDSDVLVLGELHGTQEVPTLSVALLQPLSKLGYGALALEVPADQQAPLLEWAIGKSDSPPPFFTEGNQDGRGNKQVLALIRAAVKAPHSWKLICFDQSLSGEDYKNSQTEVSKTPVRQELNDLLELSIRRDADMANRLISERQRLRPEAKALAICGSLHARTAKIGPVENVKSPDQEIMTKLWPSFAAAIQIKQPNWRVQSVNVVPANGTYAAMVSVGEEPPRAGIHKIHSGKKVGQATLRPLMDDYWDWQLEIPQATAATFLAKPKISPRKGTE